MNLRPWASKENCASVNGVLERFFTHLFVNSLVLSVKGWLCDSELFGGNSLFLSNLAFEWPFLACS